MEENIVPVLLSPIPSSRQTIVKANKHLTSRQLGQLLVLVPVMIHWLRYCQLDGASLLAADGNADHGDVQFLLHRMVDAINFSGDLTIGQITELAETSGAHVWAGALRKILIDCEPSLVPAPLCTELLKETDDVEKIKGVIEGLTRTRFCAVAELCALLRDIPQKDFPAIIGTKLLSGSSSETAGKIMEILIQKCEIIFGKFTTVPSATAIPKEHYSSTRNRQLSVLPTVTVRDALISSRKHALRAFFQWQDESRVDIVDLLFEYHDFVEIAKGVWERYDILPGGWKEELIEMKKEGLEEGMEWVPLDGSSLIKSNTPAYQNASSQQDVPKPRRTLKDMVLGQKQPEPALSSKFNSLNLIINEILDSEMYYYSVLRELQEKFVSEIREIAGGSKGTDAMFGLGMTAQDVENVFGWRLANVIDTSNMFLGKLEVVNIVRNEIQTPGGRAMVVASAFAAIATALSVNYAPFVSGHRQGMEILNQASEPMRTGSSGRPASNGGGGPSKRGGLMRHESFKMKSTPRFSSKGLLSVVVSNSTNSPNFMKIWETISAESPKLKGQSLQSIMIMPIQRVPRYKLLLMELEKKLETGHPAIPNLNVALTQISTVAQQINQALRQHEKLETMFGGNLPEIAGATNSMKTGSMRLTVSYKAHAQETH